MWGYQQKWKQRLPQKEIPLFDKFQNHLCLRKLSSKDWSRAVSLPSRRFSRKDIASWIRFGLPELISRCHSSISLRENPKSSRIDNRSGTDCCTQRPTSWVAFWIDIIESAIGIDVSGKIQILEGGVPIHIRIASNRSLSFAFIDKRKFKSIPSRSRYQSPLPPPGPSLRNQPSSIISPWRSNFPGSNAIALMLIYFFVCCGKWLIVKHRDDVDQEQVSYVRHFIY